MKYPLAESFVAPQGEGLFTGTSMLFLRLVGCSVGTKVCHACDTDYDRMLPDMGGGIKHEDELVLMARQAGTPRVCLTGGEPLDRDLRPVLVAMQSDGRVCHVETSGTKRPDWLLDKISDGRHRLAFDPPMYFDGAMWAMRQVQMWLTVSPKPGYLQSMVDQADEVKVILGGLGDGPGWPTLEDAVRWADEGKLVYLQQRNERYDIRHEALKEAIAAVTLHPRLRLSVQMHKFLRTR